MADFFDDLKENLGDWGKVISEKAEVVVKKTGEAASVVAKKTEETVEIQKLQSQIRVLKRNNERDFRDIGKMVYERYQKKEEINEEYVELCEAITERKKSIEDYKSQIAKIKGLDVCPNCGEHVESNVSFCSKCGTKLESDEDDVFEDDVL